MNAVTPFEQAAAPRRAASQATVVEQSRAVAEVQAAVVVAQQRPRDKAIAIAEMREVCQIPALAERAFFSFSRGGQTVSGASVHLARELARCWGNIDYGIKELDRDDGRGMSEMLAFAWDLQTNARSEVTFIVPHVRDTKSGRKPLTDMRDIYENNANNAARRLRECVFAVLPVWYTEEAKDICRRTIQNGGGDKPLVQRIADCIAAFASLGISKAQIEQKVGRRSDEMTPEDFGALRVLFGSIKAGEISKDEAFPREESATRPAPPNADPFEAAAAGQAQQQEQPPVAEQKRQQRNKAEPAAPKPPNSPLTGGGNWPAWTAWFEAEIGRTAARDVGKLLLDHGQEVEWLEANDALAWASIQRAIDARREEG